MADPAPFVSLLHHARQLMLLTHPADIVAASCREAEKMPGVCAVFASVVRRGEAWERGLHLVHRGGPRPLTLAMRSALFAIHRRAARDRTPLVLEQGAETAAIFGALASDTAAAERIRAAPMLTRTGRHAGELVVVTDATPWTATALSLLTELAAITCAALDSAQRLAFARRDQERLQLLAEASEEAMWDWTPATDQVWWGGGVQDLLGHGDTAVQTRLAWKFDRIHPDDAPRVRESLEAALRSNASAWRAEYRFRRADDSWLEVEDQGYFLREPDGAAYRVIGTIRDVSPLKRVLEREKTARAEAERANQSKDQFLAMLGHELRNPLAPILTAVGLMRMRGAPAVERERVVIERQARHMMRLVDDLLDVSRITRGKVELKRTRLELADAVGRAVEMVSSVIEDRRHHLELRVPARGLLVDGDAARLAQVVSNLLTNAARYTDPGGRITVVGRETEQGEVELAVRDTGVGIAPDALPRIFDLFVQGGQALDRSHGGLGLGLTLVRSLVALHGGTVGVCSEGPGKGSEFTVRLPRASTPAGDTSAANRPSEPAPARTGRRILVVDDNRDAAELLCEFLEASGNETGIAFDGPTALRVAQDFGPDVVLLDIGLPVMDGYEVARALRRQLAGGASVRLVAVTGYGRESDRARAREASFDAHLTKPVDLDLLERTLRDLTEVVPAQDQR